MTCRRSSKSGRSVWASGVRTTAGITQFARMPSGPYSTASCLVRATIPPLAAT